MRNSLRSVLKNICYRHFFKFFEEEDESYKKTKAGLSSGLVVIRIIRLHQGAQKGGAANLGALSELRR